MGCSLSACARLDDRGARHVAPSRSAGQLWAPKSAQPVTSSPDPRAWFNPLVNPHHQEHELRTTTQPTRDIKTPKALRSGDTQSPWTTRQRHPTSGMADLTGARPAAQHHRPPSRWTEIRSPCFTAISCCSTASAKHSASDTRHTTSSCDTKMGGHCTQIRSLDASTGWPIRQECAGTSPLAVSDTSRSRSTFVSAGQHAKPTDQSDENQAKTMNRIGGNFRG